jgi:hypothetical protein
MMPIRRDKRSFSPAGLPARCIAQRRLVKGAYWPEMVLPCARALFLVACLTTVKAAAPTEKPAPDGKKPPTRSYASEIATARATWTGESSQLRRVLVDLRDLADTLTSLDTQLNRAKAGLASLEAEKERALEDMRNGEFCSGCGRSRSELLAAGDRFPHEGQEKVPAKPEQIEALEQRYDQRIKAQRSQVEELDRDFRRRKAAVDDLRFRFEALRPAYHSHIADERIARVRDWNVERTTLESRLEEQRQAILAAERAVRTAAVPAAADALRVNLRILQAQFADSLRSARAAQSRATQQADGYVKTVLQDLESLSALAAPLPSTFGLPGGWYMSQTLGNPPDPVACRLAPLQNWEDMAGGKGVRELLEPGAATAPARPANSPAPKKSVRDLLEGK